MMTVTLTSLILFVGVATLTPGGATTLATASGVQFGFRRSLPMLFGIATGLALLAAAAGSGLAALLQTMPVLQLGMRVVGSSYLLWLAYRIGRAGGPNPDDSQQAEPISFLSAIVVPLINPKGWAMVLGAAASFAALASNPRDLAVILGATFGACAFASLTLWCHGGAMLANILSTERQWRVLNISLGLLLAASIVPIWLQ